MTLHRRQGREARRIAAPARPEDYRHLRHPFAAQKVLSDDAVAAIHAMALKLLEDLGSSSFCLRRGRSTSGAARSWTRAPALSALGARW